MAKYVYCPILGQLGLEVSRNLMVSIPFFTALPGLCCWQVYPGRDLSGSLQDTYPVMFQQHVSLKNVPVDSTLKHFASLQIS